MDPATKTFIMVADDNKLIGKVLANKLTAAGYEVQLVTNGEEALAAIAQRKPDLLLLDLIMPLKDGFTTLKELRADPNSSSIKVIVTSDLEQPEDMQKIKELGAIGYFNKSNLQEIVNNIPKFTSGVAPVNMPEPQ